MKPEPESEFFRIFNAICDRQVVGNLVATDCPMCKGEAKLIALLTHPRGAVFSELDCPWCGQMFRGIKIRGAVF